MTMKTATVLLLTAALLPACASTKGESYTKVGFDPLSVTRLAIVDGNNPTFKPETRQILVDSAQMEFLKKGWNIVERANIQKAIDELDFQNSDLASPDERKQLGHVLNVDALAFVNIGGNTDEMSMTIKMIDVETGDLLWMGSGDSSLNSGLSTVTGVLVGAAVGAAAGNNMGSNNAGAGAAIGGIAGGVIGHGLTPSALENAKELVQEICSSMPVRGGVPASG
jgi:hypothetical protein